MVKTKFKLGTIGAPIKSLSGTSSTASREGLLLQLNSGKVLNSVANCDCAKTKLVNEEETTEEMENKKKAADKLKNDDASMETPAATPEAMENKEPYNWNNCVSNNEGKHGREAAEKICNEAKSKLGNSASKKEVEEALLNAFRDDVRNRLDNMLKKWDKVSNTAAKPSNVADIYQRADEYLSNARSLTPELQAELDAQIEKDFVSNRRS